MSCMRLYACPPVRVALGSFTYHLHFRDLTHLHISQGFSQLCANAASTGILKTRRLTVSMYYNVTWYDAVSASNYLTVPRLSTYVSRRSYWVTWFFKSYIRVYIYFFVSALKINYVYYNLSLGCVFCSFIKYSFSRGAIFDRNDSWSASDIKYIYKI